MPIYNLIEYDKNYSKTLGILQKYYIDDPNYILTSFESLKFQIKITGKPPAAGNINDVKIAVPLQQLSNFWGTLELPSINCEINLELTQSTDCVISSPTGETKFAITDTKLYVPVVTLSTQDNANLLEQLRSGFRRTIIRNKYQSKVSTERQNQYSHFLIDPSFQGVNRLFILSFENENDRKVHTGYYLPKVETKDYNVIIDGKNFFDQPVKSDIRIYDNIGKNLTGEGDDYTTGCLLDYNYFNKCYKMMATDLSKQQALAGGSKTIQQINFTGILD